MITLTVTKDELQLLQNLVNDRRGRYGILKSQWDSDIKDYIRDLNRLKKTLNKVEKEENANQN